jgi:phosphocarrier protein
MLSERQVVILNTLGLHVRPSAEFAGTASKFKSRVSVVKEGQAVNAKSSIDLLTLAAVAGTSLTIRAEGEDAEAAVEALARLVDSRFGEE